MVILLVRRLVIRIAGRDGHQDGKKNQSENLIAHQRGKIAFQYDMEMYWFLTFMMLDEVDCSDGN